MVKLTLYGDIGLPSTQKVLILLEELELNYTFQKIEASDPELISMNPFGKTPIAVYDNRTIYESRSILRYISKANRDDSVDLYGDIYTDMWLETETNGFNVYAKAILESDDKEKYIELLEKTLDIYEDQLKKYNYISSDNYSIADISHIPYAYLLLKHGYKEIFKARPSVYNWLKRIIKREPVKNVLENKIPI